MLPDNTVLQDRYLVVRQLGQGGMGAVYEALDRKFDAQVALKETLVAGDQLRRAFEREARLLNRLRHPALPVVIDHFQEGEGWFLVMDYVAGEDLAAALARRGRAFPTADVLAWADLLLDALEYLHGHEPPIIHRDIKPHNLKVTSRGEVKLLDFGLAKGSLDPHAGTATGSVMAYTPQYAPFEQVRGTGTDHRSDLYSLGATLYHLLTNEVPVDALSRAGAVLNGQRDPLIPADTLVPTIPRAVAEVVGWAMALRLDQRPASAAVMRRALRDATVGTSTVPAEPPTAPNLERTIPVAAPASGTVPARAPADTLVDTGAATLTGESRPRPARALVASGAAAVLALAVAAGVYGLRGSSEPRPAPGVTTMEAPGQIDVPPGPAQPATAPPPAVQPAPGAYAPEAPAPKADAKPAPAPPSSGGSLKNRVETKITPTYPPAARAAGISGTVTVELAVGPTGLVNSARAISGPMPLRAAAESAAQWWTFKPSIVNGKPVATKGTIDFVFKP